MEIFLIRHTKPKIDPGIVYGQLDMPVDDSFDTEIHTIVKKLPKKPEMVITSPLERCSMLANKLCGDNYTTDPRILEYNFGKWEGKKWDDIDKNVLYLWSNDFVNIPPPDGETMKEMHRRVEDFWKELLQRNYRSIVVVTHSGVIRLLKSIVEEIPLDKIFDVKIAFGDVFRFVSGTSKIEKVY